MSRKKRSYLPGTVFHVTSRTNGKEPWFDEEMRTEIVSIFATCFRGNDAQLLAYVVMPNHYHLVVRQGATSLGRIMQSINCRIALRVQRHLSRSGHIFERRYRERPCVDPDYLRNAIVYTHLNPVRASLCSGPSQYAWSSHHVYLQSPMRALDAHSEQPDVTPLVDLFADGKGSSSRRARSDYDRFVKWRQQCDLLGDDPDKAKPPRCGEGDEYWSLHFGSAAMIPRQNSAELHRPDLRDLVRQSLRDASPPLTLDYLRLRSCASMIVSARRTIIKRAVFAGFRGADIARYLNVSEATVSVIASSFRSRAKTHSTQTCEIRPHLKE